MTELTELLAKQLMKRHLTIIGPERIHRDVYSAYNPLSEDGLPDKNDQSTFATLFRKLDILVHNEELMGPYGEDHPAVFRRFQYVGRMTDPKTLLMALAQKGFVIKITRICRKKDLTEVGKDREDELVENAKKQFAEWIRKDTIIDQREPDPMKQIRERIENSFLNRKKVFGVSLGDLLDRVFQIIILLAVVGVCFGAFLFHWITGIVVFLFTCFAWWWIRH